jgi:putative ABC transport system substrate-binding protein
MPMRTLLRVLVLFVAVHIAPAGAQATADTPRIGLVSAASAAVAAPFQPIMRQGLADVGLVEGQNILIERRYADGQYDRFPEIVAELVRLNVRLVAVVGAVTARGVMKETNTLPIVFAIVVDPVTDGVVADAQRPGGNVTGVTTHDPQQQRKRLELLVEAMPGLKRVAILGDRGVSDAQLRDGEAQARALGLTPLPLRLAGANPDIDGAFAAMRDAQVQALLVLDEPSVAVHRKAIAERAAKLRIVTLAAPQHADAGNPLNYGTSLGAGVRQMWGHVDKVLKGTKPGDLPIGNAVRYDLIVNPKAAAELGIELPAPIVQRADRVIQ